jgi:RNA polymerase sigma-70 factor (ECF subfamily)
LIRKTGFNRFTESIPNEEMEWWKTVDIQLTHDEIKKLPNGCRQVFTLFVLEEYTHKQIAENPAISESTSKTQYRRVFDNFVQA